MNPEHLRVVTHKENCAVLPGAPRRQRCTRGHDLTDTSNIYRQPGDGGRRCRACRALNAAHNYQKRKAARGGLLYRGQPVQTDVAAPLPVG